MILKYIVGIIIGWFVSIGLSNLLTVLRFGIPMCSTIIKEETDNLIICGARNLKKRYIISAIIWIIIISLVSIGCYFGLQSAIIGYIIGILLNIATVMKSSGNNENNLSEFGNSLKANIDYIASNSGKN